MITLGKRGNLPAYRKANGFILKTSLVPKVFGELAKRYADRPGGYTRIHKYGNRQGDNAPHAILELVDNPRDIRYEMTAMSVGWDILSKRVGQTSAKDLINRGATDLEELVESERNREAQKKGEVLRQRTLWNLKKVLRYRDEEGVQDLARKAGNHIVRGSLLGHISECLYNHPRILFLRGQSPSVTLPHGETRRRKGKRGLASRLRLLLPNLVRPFQAVSEVLCTWQKGF